MARVRRGALFLHKPGNVGINIPGTIFDNGATVPQWASLGPTAVYDAATNRTIFAFEGWNGYLRRIYICWFDHNLNKLLPETGPIDVGILGLIDDDHGAPALCKDHQSRWWVFGGSHNSFGPGAIQCASTNAPDDLTSWTVRTQLTGSHGYPHPNLVGSAFYVINREALANSDLGLKLRISTSLNNGAVSWGTEIFLVNLEGANGDRVYAGNCIVVGTEIWLVFSWADVNNIERKHVYFAKYETTTGNLKNFAGDVVILAANLPLDRATADASFRLYEHTGSNILSDIAAFVLDGSNNPYVFFGVGVGADGVFDVLMMRHDGVSWSTENTGAQMLGQDAVFAPVMRSNGSIELYYPPADDPYPVGTQTWGPVSLDGHLDRRIRAINGVWGSKKRIFTAETTGPTPHPAGRVCPVLNGHPNARIVFSELADGRADSFAGGLKGYSYGDIGFLNHDNVLPANVIPPVISGAPVVGHTLYCTTGYWTGYPTQFSGRMTFAFQWKAGGVAIPGATSQSFTPTATQIAAGISCDLTVTNTAGSVTVASDIVGPVEDDTAPALHQGLLAYYNLDELSGNAIDAHGARDLTDVNTVTSDVGVGGGQTARYFNGANDEALTHVDDPVFEIGQKTKTIFGWIRGDDLAATRVALGKGGNGAGGDWDWNITNAGGFQARGRNAANDAALVVSKPNGSILAATFYFVVLKYDAVTKTASLKINDGAVSSQIWVDYRGIGGTNLNALGFALGRSHAGVAGSADWLGRLQAVGFLNRLTTSAEDTFLYNGGTAARLYSDLASF